jgi:hypothetical protein
LCLCEQSETSVDEKVILTLFTAFVSDIRHVITTNLVRKIGLRARRYSCLLRYNQICIKVGKQIDTTVLNGGK